ncbi:hypothetical protein D9M68_755500 [compost metagenome]
MKLLAFMPSDFACWFISSTKRSTLPPNPSASATVASLPDCTITPLIRSSTGTCILGSMNMREPGIFQARGLTGRVWVSVIFLARSASNATYAVISLVSEAGSTGLSMSFCARIWFAVTSSSR